MNIIQRLLSLVLVLVILLSNSLAVSETVRVNQTLSSMFISLKLDANVVSIQEGTPLEIYATNHPPINALSWATLFANNETDVLLDGESISYEREGMFAKYFADESRLCISYSKKDHFKSWDLAKIGEQATGLITTPEQACESAQAWINQLEKTLGWTGYVLSACYAMPSVAEWYSSFSASDSRKTNSSENDCKGCYVVEFIKMVGNYPVAYDQSPFLDDTSLYYTKGDHIQLTIDDSGICFVEGFCRSFEIKEVTDLKITLDEAIDILKENMDYSVCYPNDLPCEITEIGLCYRLVQTHPNTDKNASARMEARPAWRFANKINRRDQQVFFMFIDAVTGEVLP